MTSKEDSIFSIEGVASKTFNQKEDDLVFSKGKVIKSKVMNSPIFKTTIERFGLDAAKTVILQELMKLSNAEIMTEVEILATIAEENTDVKRALRAAKIMAIQWHEDPKRNEDERDKCEFIISVIPTFKVSKESVKKLETAKKEEENQEMHLQTPQQIQTKKAEIQKEEEIKTFDLSNRPSPPSNPIETPITKTSDIFTISRGEKILIITDIQGNYTNLRDTLLKNNLISYSGQNVVWNNESKTKLVLMGDIFNKSPYSNWGDQVYHHSFQVIELIRDLIGKAPNNILLCLGNYDLKYSTEQIFKDSTFGFCGTNRGIKTQAQALPIFISFLDNIAFDEPDNIYSMWERDSILGNKIIFKLKSEFQINGRPNIKITSNDTNSPDVSSIRNLLVNLYKELTISKILPKNLEELDKKAKILIKQKEGEDISALANSLDRLCLFEGMLKGTKTIDFLRKFTRAYTTFKTERDIKLNFAHVSYQDDIGKMFDFLKENNWKEPDFLEFLKNSKYLKMRRIDHQKLYNNLTKLGFNTLNEFICEESESIFEKITKNNLLDAFVPEISPNKVKFGFVIGINKLQEALIKEDSTGILGFRLIDRKQEKDFDGVEMKKLGNMDANVKTSYAEKVLSDIFDNKESSGFKITPDENNFIICEKKPMWKITIEIDKSAALYQDANKAIHVPIKHNALLEYN